MGTGEETDADVKRYTAGDVRETADLSYRMLNDWEAKGVLPSRDDLGWRKFSLRELFALAVCAEIRSRFGVPLGDLKWVMRHIVEAKRDYLGDAAECILILGDPVFILTDLRRRLYLAPAFALERMYQVGYFLDPEENSFLLLRLNPLIRRLLEKLPHPDRLAEAFRLPYHGRAREILQPRKRSKATANATEEEALRLIRDRAYRRVTVFLKDGQIARFEAEQDVDVRALDADVEKLQEIIEGKAHQAIQIKTQDGKLVRVTRSISIKPTNAHDEGRRSSRRDRKTRSGQKDERAQRSPK